MSGFLNRINRLVNQVKIRLTYLQVSLSPVDALREYQRASGQLTILLYSVNTPIIGLILATTVLSGVTLAGVFLLFA